MTSKSEKDNQDPQENAKSERALVKNRAQGKTLHSRKQATQGKHKCPITDESYLQLEKMINATERDQISPTNPLKSKEP